MSSTYSPNTVNPLFKSTRQAARGATPNADERAAPLLPHWASLAIAAGLLLVITLVASGPQEAAPLGDNDLLAGSLESDSLASLEALEHHQTDATDALEGTINIEPDVVSGEATEAFPWLEQTVRNGDNLSLIFSRAGFSDRDVYEVTRADGGKALRRIYPGQIIAFRTDDEGKLTQVKHTESALRWTTFSRHDGRYTSQVTERETELREQTASLTIKSSLFIAGEQAGLSGKTIMDLATIFGGVIDFALDPRVGDTIELVYEEQYLDGEKYADGAIVAAAFTNRGETYQAFRYTDLEGDTSYYNELGVSMRKAFLKAPLDFTRVSSNFNPNRLHPIYKTKRPHRGTDYAASRGTPVYAAGDGKVIEAGYTRANGNYVFIQHGETFRTHYLHLHKLKAKRGQRVKQGDIIGTVGSTGAATGPHLHYEFLVNGVHRNPRTVHKLLPKARSLPKTELARFESLIASPLEQLAALQQRTRLALQ